MIDKTNALVDARTLYDLACIAADDPKAGREKVQAREIALRNYKFIEALAAPPAGEVPPYCYEVRWADEVTTYPKTMPARTENALVIPLYTTPPAASVVAVDEAMVDRAIRAFENEPASHTDDDWDRRCMRAALTAALAQQEPSHYGLADGEAGSA